MIYSYSRINTYKTCPKLYWYKYIEGGGKKSLPTPAMSEGLREHEKIAQGNIPEFFEPFFEKRMVNPVFEEQITADFITFELTGILDCYSISNNTAYIVDWKLHQIPENDDQLKIYSLLLLNKYNFLDRFNAYFVSIKGGFFKSYSYTADEVEKYLDDLVDIIQKIETDTEYKTQPSDRCAYCPFVSACYQENMPSLVNKITDIETAKELAAKVYIAESFLKQVKEELKNYMFESGIDEITFDKNRVYLSTSISLRFGKVKKQKSA